MKLARRIHTLLGVFFAPSILYFAATGLIQVIGLQDRSEGYTPPALISHLAEVHKHQKWQPRRRPPTPPGAQSGATTLPPAGATAPSGASPSPQAPASPTAPREEPRTRPGTTALKAFCILMSTGLVTTAALGLYMAWLVPRDRKLVAALVVVGAVLPAAFLFF